MTQREMSNVSFASELLDYFPTSRVATLIGFCVLWQLSGSPSAVQVGRGEKRVLGYSRASVYRQLGDLRRFRKHLIEKGYESERLSDSSNRHEQGLDEVEELADRIARLREYLPAA
jgi:HAMP domain-containing protein